MTMTRALQSYVNWALTYPPLEPPDAREFSHCPYCYYSPFDDGPRERGFYYTPSPRSLEQLHAGRLIPVSMPARIQFALDYFQGETAMVWNTDTGGALITYYEHCRLWGRTAFTAREGKRATVLAKTREPLMAAVLNGASVPRLGQVKRVLQLPGMETLRPVLLETVKTPHDALFPSIQRYQIQAATDQVPWFVIPGSLSLWLITIFCEERSMTLDIKSTTRPTVAHVLSRALSVASALESSPDRQTWEEHNGAEEDPYEICVMQAQACKDVLGAAYPDCLRAFRDTEADRQLITSQTARREKRLQRKGDNQ
jgi:hypothetical protein